MEQLPTRCIPQVRTIGNPLNQHAASIFAELNITYTVRLAYKAPDQLSCVHIPLEDLTVQSAGQGGTPVRGKSDADYHGGMPGKMANNLPGRHVPQNDRSIRCPRQEGFPIGSKGDPYYRLLRRKAADNLSRIKVP